MVWLQFDANSSDAWKICPVRTRYQEASAYSSVGMRDHTHAVSSHLTGWIGTLTRGAVSVLRVDAVTMVGSEWLVLNHGKIGCSALINDIKVNLIRRWLNPGAHSCSPPCHLACCMRRLLRRQLRSASATAYLQHASATSFALIYLAYV